MTDWYLDGLEDDMRPRMFAAADRGEAFSLVTIVAAEGGGPRGPGAQMVVTADAMAGDAERLMAQGFDDAHPKPIQPAGLLATVAPQRRSASPMTTDRRQPALH
jgi:CheY-like chemotaxis protein